MKVLLIEDDDVFIKLLTKTLKAHHFIIDTVKDGEMGWTYGSTFEYDILIIDIVLPKLDGITLCRRLRAEGYTTPIMLLTSQDASTSRVQGLDAGADDYIVKPFDSAELIARMRALLRRSSTNPFPLLTWGDLILNPSTCEVSYRGQQLSLTTKEYELLELMMRDSQHMFSTDELLDHLWSSEKFPSEATVRSHIRRVRQKLVAIGAPQDFISTMHGRGYYLKAQKSDEPGMVRSPHPVATTEHRPVSSPGEDDPLTTHPSPDTQHQYLAFLNQVWATTKPDSLNQMTALLEAIQDLRADQLTPQHRAEAQQLAHKLAGTLSVFGLPKAVYLVRQLENWFGSQDAVYPSQAPLMANLVAELQQVIQQTTEIEFSQLPHGHAPKLLLVSADDEFNQSLRAVAFSRGVQLEVVLPSTLNAVLASLDAATHPFESLPDVMLVHISSDATGELLDGSSLQPDLLIVIKTLTQRYPTLPILVLGDRLELAERLEVMRHGGKLLLDYSTPPEQIVATAMNALRGSKLSTKVMIVDDDQYWLRTLPTLLKPWGLKVTTLADPQQFWTVLQAVVPDVLVLDVNMPEINGLELCQVLRSDPQWQRLPVLFLSVLTDPSTQQQAFTAGADDYLYKPMMGGELASRILSRLQRVRAWAS